MTRTYHFSLALDLLPDLAFRLVREDGSPLARGKVSFWQAGQDLLVGASNFAVSDEVEATTPLGRAVRRTAWAEFPQPGGALRQTLTIDRYPHWPGAFFLRASVKNTGTQPVQVDAAAAPALALDRSWAEPAVREVWAMEGAATAWGQDFAARLPVHARHENYLGHIDNGEGGGIPMVYVWDAHTGLALAHVEAQPKTWYLPVRVDPQHGVGVALEDWRGFLLQPGETWTSLQAMISRHTGDFFSPLARYREVLTVLGSPPAEYHAEDYAPAWCSWGYEFDVRPQEMLGALPKVQALGIHWLTLDDRWFDNYGDWNPRADTFPGGEAQMRAMVDEIHAAGAYAQLWWYPLAVEDGVGGYDSHTYATADLLRQHPDWIILNQDGSTARNNRGLAILDPALPEVQAYLAAQTRRFIADWGFDGHKLDNIYAVPPCYNPAHHHHRPEESFESMSTAYRIIFETTRQLKPTSVTQICPCGTPPLYTLLPYMDQAVTADPTSSAQIRQRIKFYKGLLGSRAPVFADHVELSDGGIDFPSEIGTGGILATKFIWPEDETLRPRLQEWWTLPPEKEALYRRWFALAEEHALADGVYLNLYDLAFDCPETHAIRKEGRMYYAFYSSQPGEQYHGPVVFRGLGPGVYRVLDYVHGRSLGVVRGPEAVLTVDFDSALLVFLSAVDLELVDR